MIYHQQQTSAWCPTQKNVLGSFFFRPDNVLKTAPLSKGQWVKENTFSHNECVGCRGHMAYAVTYMRSILGSIPFLVKLYTYFLCRDLFLAPPPSRPRIFHISCWWSFPLYLGRFLRHSYLLVLLIYFCVFLLFHIKKLHRIVEQQVAIK